RAVAVAGRVVLEFVFLAAERELRVVGHLGIRIAQLAEVAGARANVEVAEQGVVVLAGLGLGDGALGILDVAEDDRLGRAGLFTGNLDGAVGDEHVGGRAGGGLALDLGLLDALDAVGALFH